MVEVDDEPLFQKGDRVHHTFAQDQLGTILHSVTVTYGPSPGLKYEVQWDHGDRAVHDPGTLRHHEEPSAREEDTAKIHLWHPNMEHFLIHQEDRDSFVEKMAGLQPGRMAEIFGDPYVGLPCFRKTQGCWGGHSAVGRCTLNWSLYDACDYCKVPAGEQCRFMVGSPYVDADGSLPWPHPSRNLISHQVGQESPEILSKAEIAHSHPPVPTSPHSPEHWGHSEPCDFDQGDKATEVGCTTCPRCGKDLSHGGELGHWAWNPIHGPGALHFWCEPDQPVNQVPCCSHCCHSPRITSHSWPCWACQVPC